MRSSLLAVTLLFGAAEGFGGCGCRMCTPCQVCTPCLPCLPPPCPPPPIKICPPLPPPCPPPPICPPAICPPPVICPPPPPPPPPPVCPPPLPPPPPAPCPMPLPRPMPLYVSLPQNDCCCFCAVPCQFSARTRLHGARIFTAKSAQIEEDPSCNNPKLRAIMEENIVADPSTSKRAIQGSAEKQLSAKFNVICAKGDFSYVAYTESFCQTSKNEVTCYAFQSL